MIISKNQIKFICSLHQKKFREEHRQFIAEGEKIALELLNQHKYKIVGLFALEKWIETHKNILNSSKIKFFVCSDKDMEKITTLKSLTPVIVLLENSQKFEIQLQNKLTLLLDNIQDPGNLGTIIRTADWFGIENIICSEDTVDFTNPKVLQATMGSFLRVNISYFNINNFILDNTKIPCYAAVLNGKNISEIDFPEEMFLLIGNEGKGISEKLLSLPNISISIPKFGKAESLNAAVATAIICAKIRM